MPTRPGQSKALLDDLLEDDDPVAVEAAIARLAIIGRPAVRQVVQRLGTADAVHLPRLLRVLERMGEPSTLRAIQPWLAHDAPEVALAAVDAAGTLLDARDAAIASEVFDVLTATLLDRTRPPAVRLRAFDAIANAPDRSPTYDADVLEPLREQLRRDPSPEVQQGLRGAADVAPTAAVEPAGEDGLEAIDTTGQLPRDAETLRLQILAHGQTASLSVLHRIIERVRALEARVEGEDLERWRVVRATAHLALSARGSRLALYDLRETLDALGAQTPVGMLSALQQVGDASVLDALADAYASSNDAWFRGQLVGIFRAVVARERITKRQATMKKLAARLPDAFTDLWG